MIIIEGSKQGETRILKLIPRFYLDKVNVWISDEVKPKWEVYKCDMNVIKGVAYIPIEKSFKAGNSFKIDIKDNEGNILFRGILKAI